MGNVNLLLIILIHASLHNNNEQMILTPTPDK